MSGIAFARVLGKFDGWRRSDAQLKDPCTKRINLLAHSMGNRVLRNSLQQWSEHEGASEMPQLFRNIFMIAADVVNHTLEHGEPGALIPLAARNVVVYYANDDLAMPASKIVNLKNRTVSRRLGMTGPEDLDAIAKNVFEADCDDFNNTFDKPKGHTYFTAHKKSNTISPVMKHMIHAVRYGRVKPSDRHIVLQRPSNLKR